MPQQLVSPQAILRTVVTVTLTAQLVIPLLDLIAKLAHPGARPPLAIRLLALPATAILGVHSTTVPAVLALIAVATHGAVWAYFVTRANFYRKCFEERVVIVPQLSAHSVILIMKTLWIHRGF